MREFKSFYFEKFSFDKQNLLAKFEYSFDESYFFTEEINFSSVDFFVRKNLNEHIINNFLFSLHIAIGISYYKSFPTEKLFVKSGILDEKQIHFWQKFYKNGLGEFLFINKISPDNLFQFENIGVTRYEKIDFSLSEKSLIPLGGGKDSLVSIDLFTKSKLDYDLVVFGKIDDIKQNCARVLDKKILLITRKISPSLLVLNNEGNYNGHVPITGIIAFVLAFTSYLYDYKYLVLSNEKSASVGNTFWNDFEINHQYSKSLEFENDFKDYLDNYLSKDIAYFSLLRGWYEIKIGEYFAKNCKKFFGVFSSCNNNFKIDETKRLKQTIWCNSCPKCAFVFAILRPYLSNDEILSIFGEDLFLKQDLKQTFLELLGISAFKPFECVGEVEEVVLVFYKSLKLYKNDESDILNEFVKNISGKYDEKYFKDLEEKFATIYDDDIIPQKIKEIILKNI
ncbi:MAG: hypothetical protein PHH98_02470 [Candidatus Gracilibacteria bacterium]|nr:hypothetical protein [Candidatus Gracilibacteria bacterium]